MSEPVEEIAQRIKAARFCCERREVPCSCCTSKIFQGCMYLAEAVLTPRVALLEYEPMDTA